MKGLCRSCKQEGNIARNYPSEAWCRLQADNAAERSADPIPAEAQHLASGPTGSSSTAAKRAKNTTDYRQNEKKNYSLQTKKINRLPTWTAIIDICFQKEEIRRAFCIFSSLRSNLIEGNCRISCHLLTFLPEERGIILQNNFPYSSPRNLRYNISTTSFVQLYEWNHKSDSEFFPKRRRSRNRTPPQPGSGRQR